MQMRVSRFLFQIYQFTIRFTFFNAIAVANAAIKPRNSRFIATSVSTR